MGFFARGVRPSGSFGVGALYINHYKNKPGKKTLLTVSIMKEVTVYSHTYM